MRDKIRALIERFDHLRNSGVCSPTTRGLLDDAEALLTALSSPPADDVREATRTNIADGISGIQVGTGYESTTIGIDAALEAADAIRAMFEVRLRALPSPPADDVREALATNEEVSSFPAEYFKATKLREQVLDVIERAMNERFDIGHIGDSLIAAFEVRPRGTVTDIEVAWEYGVRHVDVDGWSIDVVHTSLRDARTDLATCGWNCSLIRRREAGKWEPVDTAREAHS